MKKGDHVCRWSEIHEIWIHGLVFSVTEKSFGVRWQATPSTWGGTNRYKHGHPLVFRVSAVPKVEPKP